MATEIKLDEDLVCDCCGDEMQHVWCPDHPLSLIVCSDCGYDWGEKRELPEDIIDELDAKMKNLARDQKEVK